MPEIVRPKPWDLGALVCAGIGVVLAGANLAASGGDAPMPGSTTTTFVLLQLGLCMLSLMILGKTAKMGTIWGNLLAVGGAMIGMSGVLLATALWALA
jgi:hypothetical protein